MAYGVKLPCAIWREFLSLALNLLKSGQLYHDCVFILKCLGLKGTNIIGEVSGEKHHSSILILYSNLLNSCFK